MKITKSILVIASVAIAFFIIGSCGNKKVSTPEPVVEEIAVEETPISGVQRLIDEATRYNSLYAEEQRASMSAQNPMPNVAQDVDTIKKMYVFEYVWNEEIQSMDKLNHENGMKNVLQEMSSNPVSFNFMKLLAEEGYGIRFNVEGSKTHKRVSNEASADEIRNLVDNTY